MQEDAPAIVIPEVGPKGFWRCYCGSINRCLHLDSAEVAAAHCARHCRACNRIVGVEVPEGIAVLVSGRNWVPRDSLA